MAQSVEESKRLSVNKPKCWSNLVGCTHFIGLLKLEANVSLKLSIMQTLINSINIF